jgi:hypothetical protein
LTSNNAAVLAKVPPQTIENPEYGFSVGRGAWTFHANAWNTIAERIKLNDPGGNNGKYRLVTLRIHNKLKAFFR